MVAYTRDVPDAPNNPSVDQPKMKQNTNGIDDILQVDHISFNANNGGTHLQNTYAGFSAGAVLGNPASSTAYPAAGIADATKAQYYFKNSSAITGNTFLLSGLRAFAFVTGSSGAITGGQSSNVSGIVHNAAGKFTVTLAANTLATADYLVFISAGRTSNTQMVHSYNILTLTSFELFFSFPITGLQVDPSTFCFAVIQI